MSKSKHFRPIRRTGLEIEMTPLLRPNAFKKKLIKHNFVLNVSIVDCGNTWQNANKFQEKPNRYTIFMDWMLFE